MTQLLEYSRQELINKSKSADNYAPNNQQFGKNRYERRLRSKVANSVKEYNAMDMNQLFKEGILVVNILVHGETDDYLVKIKFGNILEEIHEQLERSDNKLTLRVIIRALISAFNHDNVYIRCDCPDFNFRFSYWSKVNDISSDPEIEQPTNGNYIVNPKDTKGAACKHCLLVLNNNSWITKVSATIFNYVNYMEKHYQKLYADVIYPAIYQQDYEDDVQLSIDDIEDDDGEIVSDKDTLDISNKWARTKNQFKPGNQSGVQFASKGAKSPNKQFDFDSLMSD